MKMLTMKSNLIKLLIMHCKHKPDTKIWCFAITRLRVYYMHGFYVDEPLHMIFCFTIFPELQPVDY